MSKWLEISKMQNDLDKRILDKFNLSSKETATKRILSLLVELAELANETRCFKYWSIKSSAAKEIILEEYADGIHFLISLGNEIEYDFSKSNLFSKANKKQQDLTVLFIQLFEDVVNFNKNFNNESFEILMVNYITLGFSLALTEEEIIDFYIKKNKKNHDRQENNY